MKKTTKKNLLILFVSIILLLFTGIYACKKFDLNTSLLSFGELITINNNEIVFFDAGFLALLHDYVNISFQCEKSENLEDGLKFDIINPKGEVVESGMLTDGEIFSKSYNATRGEWKVVFNLKDEDSKVTINGAYSVNSTKDNPITASNDVSLSFPAQ